MYRVLLPTMDRDETRARLGYGAPAYARMMARDDLFYMGLAEELGDWWMRVRHECTEGTDSGVVRRIERRLMTEAAEELLRVVAGLPGSVREVVELRAAGVSWTRIVRHLPDRAYFSIRDDWERAVRLVGERHDDLVRRLLG